MDNDNTPAREYPPRHTLPADLAAALRAARQDRGLGLREAADLAGVDAGHLSRIERGLRCPSLAIARDLVAALELAPDLAAWLLAIARPDAGRSAPRPWRPPEATLALDNRSAPDLMDAARRA
jgi:transcriptional regulator with XRE-family HTH domain